MKLHAVHRKLAMGEAHDEVTVGLGRHGEFVWHGVMVDHQRVIPRRPERPVDAAKHALAAVPHLGKLAVHRHWCPHHAAAEHLTDRLMAEADAEYRDSGRSSG